jgi:predicted nucleic acid-binding protein
VAAAYTAYFADSSALVNRYVQETGTAWVRRLTRRSPSTAIYAAHITAVEVTSAVARRRKDPTLTTAKASSIHLLGSRTSLAVILVLRDQQTNN